MLVEELEDRYDEEEIFESHLLSVTSALGEYPLNSKDYSPGFEVIDCLKDLKRFLKLEDEAFAKNPTDSSRLVFLLFGKWNTLRSHLIPLMLFANKTNNFKLFSYVVEVLVPLTWPLVIPKSLLDAETSNKKKPPTIFEVYPSTYFDTLRNFKDAFSSNYSGGDVFVALVDNLTALLAKDEKSRTDREHAMIRLILLLFRNILAIRDGFFGTNTSSLAMSYSLLQEKIIVLFERQNVFDLLCAFAGSMDGGDVSSWNLIILEILYCLVHDRDCKEIVSENSKNQVKELSDAMKKENCIKKRRVVASRHSRFGGCLTLKRLNGNKLTVTHAFTDINSFISLADSSKKAPNMIKKVDKQVYRKFESPEVREIFKNFAISILENGFNSLMLSVKRDIDAEREKITEEDYLRYFKVSTFFLGILRHCKEFDELNNFKDAEYDFKHVTSVVNTRGIAFVNKRLHMFVEEKNPTYVFVTLELLRELLLTLRSMSKSPDETYNDIAKNIESNLFYEQASLKILQQIIRNCKNESKGFLELLVDTVHIQMKMLESFAKSKEVLLVRREKKIKGGDDDYNRTRFVEGEIKFLNIEMTFAYEGLIEVYCSLLKNFETLSNETVTQIAYMFHKIFVKLEMEAIFYKLSFLNLFNRILLSKNRLPSPLPSGFVQLFQFINYCTKKLFKNLESYPHLFMEILFHKNKSDTLRIQGKDSGSSSFSIDNVSKEDHIEELGSSEELAIRSRLKWSEQVGAVVTTMVELGRREILEWLIEILEELRKVKSEKEFYDDDDQNLEDYEIPNRIKDGQETSSLSNDNKLKLLLKIFMFKRRDLAEEVKWTVPGDMRSLNLQERIDLIKQYMETPFEYKGKSAVLLLKKKVLKKKKERAKKPDDDEDGKKIKRRKREVEVTVNELSAEFIDDSDDMNDDEFFKAEAERRRKYHNGLKKDATATAIDSSQRSVVKEGGVEDVDDGEEIETASKKSEEREVSSDEASSSSSEE